MPTQEKNDGSKRHRVLGNKSILFGAIAIAAIALLAFSAQQADADVDVIPGNSVEATLGPWGGTGHVYDGYTYDVTDGNVDIYFYGVDGALLKSYNDSNHRGTASAGVTAGTSMAFDPPANSFVWYMLEQCTASGTLWNGNSTSTAGIDGVSLTNDDSRSWLFQDWYRPSSGGKVAGSGQDVAYNRESYITPNPDFPNAPTHDASYYNTFDLRVRINHTGGDTYTYEGWIRRHNSAATEEGYTYDTPSDPPQWHAINNVGPEIAWRKIADSGGNTVFSISDINLTAVHPFVGLGNWGGDTYTQKTSWDNIIVIQGDINEVWVDDNYNEYTPGWNVTHFDTIQAAIDAVEGSTVHIAAGTYDEQLNINKSVTIIGAGPDQTFLKSTAGSPVITVSADDVTIQDLEITSDTELVEGIRVVSGASENLAVDNVDVTNLGHPTGSNSYGIYLAVSFANLSVDQTDFVPVTHTAANRTIGIFAPNHLQLSNFDITDSSFAGIWTGIYLRSAIDDFYATGNTFGYVQSCDFAACVSGIYIGDGDDNDFDVENITVYDNTFTDYGRGVYIWNYANHTKVSNVEIYENTFTNTVWSSAVRFIAGLGVVGEEVSFESIDVHNNTFTQDSDVGAHVALIDFRSYCYELQSSHIAVKDNDITFSGGPYTDPMSGIQFMIWEGPFSDTVVIEGNTLDGGNTGGTGDPPSSGILVRHWSSDYWPADTFDMDITYNTITAFDNGVTIYDAVDGVYGNLTDGSMVNVNYNNIDGNALYGVRNDKAEVVDATYNWWGDISGPTHATNAGGTGDSITDNVTYCPWLVQSSPQGVPTTVYVDDDWSGSCMDEVATGKYFGLNAFATIQDGIDNVVGSTVDVAAGDYPETLDIDKPVILLGPNAGVHGTSGSRSAEATIHYPAGMEASSPGSWAPLIWIDANDVTIDGFKITDDGFASSVNYSDSTGITNNYTIPVGNNTMISNNIVDGNFSSISVWMCAWPNGGAYLSGVEITDNYVTGNHGLYHAMYLQETAGIVSGNTIDDCAAAIQVQPYQNPIGGTVTNNNFSGYVNGLYYNYASRDAAKWVIEENHITPCAAPSWKTGTANWSGLYLRTFGTQNPGGATAPEVEFNNNTVDGTGASSTEPFWDDIRAVRIRYTDGRAKATFYGNTFTNCETGVYVRSDANVTNTAFHHNNFIDNDMGVNNTAPQELSATCNWWGSFNGPQHSSNPTGTGEAVSDNVDFIPWLDAPYPDGSCTGEPGMGAWNHWSNSPHMYNMNDGNVGVGTDTPETKLDVNGSFRVQSGSASHLFFVDSSSGNVGIGTSSPSQPLHIVTGAHSTGVLVEALDTGGNNPMLFRLSCNNPASSSDPQFLLENAADSYQWSFRTWHPSEGFAISKIGTGGAELQITSVPNASFTDVGLNLGGGRLFVDQATGNVGIGTTNPAAELEVEGTTMTETMQLDKLTSPPSSPSDGQIAYSDGSWGGSGEGIYAFYDTSWHYLG